MWSSSAQLGTNSHKMYKNVLVYSAQLYFLYTESLYTGKKWDWIYQQDKIIPFQEYNLKKELRFTETQLGIVKAFLIYKSFDLGIPHLGFYL